MEIPLLTLTIILITALGFVAPACVPEEEKLYWKSPCDGQKFDNRIIPKKLTITQNGKEVDENGGVDLSVDAEGTLEFENNYGPIKKPLCDITARIYTRLPFGKCQWFSVPTFGFGDNWDPCKISPHCHLNQSETSVTVTANHNDLPSIIRNFIIVGDYYSGTVTCKDDKTLLACAYGQVKIAKK